MHTFHLPYPPTVNSYYRRAGQHLHISKDGRQYRAQLCRKLEGVREIAGDLFVSIDVFFPDKRRRDLDNLLKGLLDALQHAGVYDDDSQIKDLRIRATGFAAGGFVVVSIKEIQNGNI